MKISLDHHRLEVEGRKTVLEAARENGVYIPSLCDHPRLRPFGGCRLCLVDLKDRDGLVSACATLVEDGMQIVSDRPDLRKLRRAILELILAERPGACLIFGERGDGASGPSASRKSGEITGCGRCPRLGRCGLQTLVDSLGPLKPPTPMGAFRSQAHADVRPDDLFFERDGGRCLLCGRCVRICREIRGASALAFLHRGTGTAVGTGPGQSLLDAGCQFCGACVDVCPSGAIVSKAASAVPAPDTFNKSICLLCGQGCELTVGSNQGKIVTSVPAEDGPANRGQACVKGRFLLSETVHHPRRLLKPMVRRSGRLEDAGWDEALSLVGRKLSAFEPREIACFTSAQDSCEDIYAFRKLGIDGLKTPHVAGAEDFSALAALLSAERARSAETSLNLRVSDVCAAKIVFIFGEDLSAVNPILGTEVNRSLRRGGKLFVIGDEESCFHRQAAAWIKLSPGKEADFLYALCGNLREGEIDDGSEGMAESKSRYPGLHLEDSGHPSGLSEDKLRRLAAILGKRKPAVFLFGTRFARGGAGKRNLDALLNLAAQTRGTVLPLDTEGNVRGAVEIAQSFGPDRRPPAAIYGSILKGAYKALYLAGPSPRLARRPAEFVILQDAYAGAGSEFADVLLPQATFAETAGVSVNVEGRVQKFEPAIAPLGESRPGWRIVSDIARTMALPGFEFKSAADVFQEMAGRVTAFRGMRHPALKGETFLAESEKPRRFPAAPPNEEEYPATPEFGLDHYKGLVMSRDIVNLRTIRERGSEDRIEETPAVQAINLNRKRRETT